jgi:hypothetical protein
MTNTTLTNGNNINIMSYGKSMYGGWYLDYFNNTKGCHEGIGAITLRELCAKACISRTALQRDVQRLDN